MLDLILMRAAGGLVGQPGMLHQAGCTNPVAQLSTQSHARR
jgi:hypothetical protein